MNEEKFVNLQHQMRQNQSDLQDYLRGLESWTSDIKEKDSHLKEQQNDPDQKSLPPIRNSLLKKKKKKKAKPDTKGIDKPKRINSYDYRAWDKFVDQQEKAGDDKAADAGDDEEDEDDETDEEWEEERKQLQAAQYKDMGNQFFKEGNYDKAVEAYTKGCECDPGNAILPANRAMALLKQEKYAAAENDCNFALLLDPDYVKAYFRRGAARAALGKYDAARIDYMKVIEKEPHNKQARAELDKINMKIRSGLAATTDSGIVKAISKPPEKRSKKPLKRIEIEEIGQDEGEAHKKAVEEAIKGQSEVKKKVVAEDNKLFEKFTSQKESETQDSLKINLSDIHNDNHEGKSQRQSNKKASSVESSPDVSPRIPQVPTTSYQFQKDWKTLKGHPEKFYNYFKVVDSANYSKLFGEALDSEILLQVLTMFRDYYPSDQDVLANLESLSKVKRFSMTTMFLSSAEKKVISELFDKLKSQNIHNEDDIRKIAKLYGL